MELSKRNAETLVHTSVQSVANTTREKIFSDNNDVVSGKEWCSALDRRTCPTCGVRDGKRWTTDSKPISHSIPYTVPPLHFRCRCSMVPVLKTWEELGIDMQELPDGTRASMEGQVNDKTFADWLKRKTETDPSFADKTLGKGRAELFRGGKLTMDQMISGGKPLSLAELKGKYGAPIIGDMEDQLKNIIGKDVYENAIAELSIRNLPKNITEAEKISLYAWTLDTSSDAIYQKINDALRTGVGLEHLKPMINIMNSALDKLPDYKGTVYRAVKEKPFSKSGFKEYIGSHEQGASVVYYGFTSSSIDENQILRGRAKIKIESLTGKNISLFSSKPEQQEVLFNPKSVFDVIENYEQENTVVRIWLNQK